MVRVWFRPRVMAMVKDKIRTRDWDNVKLGIWFTFDCCYAEDES